MDAITGFFAKYAAVPADPAGPRFDLAADETLVNWQMAYRKLVKLNPHDGHAAATYQRLREEIRRRFERDGWEKSSPHIVAAWLSEWKHKAA